MNNPFKCLIVEDEPLAQNVLKNYISQHPLLYLSAVCPDATQAQQWLSKEQVDLLLLDINLPRLSGISFLKTLSRPPLVIFTTAYPEYAVDGFELDAVDYLVKPFSFERFLKAVNRAVDKLSVRDAPAAAPTSIFVKADKKAIKIDLADIQYVEALDDYIKIVTNAGNYLVHDTLKGLLEELPASSFLRVHKSYIISVDRINFIEGNFIRMADRDIPIGASYREGVFTRLKI